MNACLEMGIGAIPANVKANSANMPYDETPMRLFAIIFAGLFCACSSAETSLLVTVDNGANLQTPEYLRFSVRRDATYSVRDLRVPESGSLTVTYNPVATVQVNIEGQSDSPRQVDVAAFRDGVQIARASAFEVIAVSGQSTRVYLLLTPLAVGPSTKPPGAHAGLATVVDSGPPGAGPDGGVSPVNPDAMFTKDAANSVVVPDAALMADTNPVTPDAPVIVKQNLVVGGDFEGSTVAWITVSGTSGAFGSGPSSRLALRSDTTGTWVQQDVKGFRVGQSHTLTGWMKGTGATCSLGFSYGRDAVELKRHTVASFAAEWSKGSLTFTIPTEANWLLVFIHNNGTPECWTDDVALVVD